MTEATPKKKFYDDEYWQKGQGQLLWNMRKMLGFIMAISNEETPNPFFTSIHESDNTPEVWVGWSAEWGDVRNNSLTIEYEGDEFSVYAFHITEDDKLEYTFSYWFGGDPESKDYTPWDKLDDAVRDAKQWLLEHKNALNQQYKKEDSLKRLFNLD